MNHSQLQQKLKKIQLIVFDIDGVLTDGKIYLLNDKEELKAFWAKDAPRTRIASRSGIKVLFFTRRKSSASIRRARELGVDILFKEDLKQKNEPFFDKIKKKYSIKPEHVLYVGDDWNDLHLMKKAGIAATPADGSPENKKIAHIITKARGGEGVASEIIEVVMRTQNTWNKYVKEYFNELLF